VNVRILCGGGAGGQGFLFNRAPSLIAESMELKAISECPNDWETMEVEISC